MARDDFVDGDVPGSNEALSARERELRLALQTAQSEDERLALLRSLREVRDVAVVIDSPPVGDGETLPQWQAREISKHLATDPVAIVADRDDVDGPRSSKRSGFLLSLLVLALLLVGAGIGFVGARVGDEGDQSAEQAGAEPRSVVQGDRSDDRSDQTDGHSDDDETGGVESVGSLDEDDEDEDEDEDEDDEDEDDDGSDDAADPAATSPRIMVADPIVILELHDFEFVATVTVGDEAEHKAILEAIDRTYGEFGTGIVSVDSEGREPAFGDALATIIQNFGRMIEGSLQVGDDSAVLHGTVPSEDALAALVDELSPDRGFPPIDVSGVSVSNADAAELDVEAVDGVMRLDGTLPDARLAERLVAAAVGLYGAENVIDDLEIDPDAYALFDVARFDAVIEVFSTGGDFEIKMLEGGFFGVIEDGIEFKIGGHTLDAAAVELLSGFPALINRTTVDVTIAGHTDSRGSPETNQLLSEARAQSVATYLEGQGVDPSRFVVLGRGQSEPLASNATSEGRARNRRVIITMGFEDD